MISRRAALQLGAIVGGVGFAGFMAQEAGILDEGLRAVGARPHAESDPRDVALLRQAAEGQADLLSALDAVGHDPLDLRSVLREQLAAVSDEPTTSPPASAVAEGTFDFATFGRLVEAEAAARADGAMSAGSLAVIKVLATMSAGLEQVAVAALRLA